VLLYRKPGRSAGAFRTFTLAGDDETFSVDIEAGAQADWYRAEVRGLGFPTSAAQPLPAAEPVVELKALVSPVFISPAPVNAAPELAVPADAGVEDGAIQAIGAPGAFTGFPDLATDAGVVHLVAEAHRAGVSEVVHRRLSGVWGGVRVLSGGGVARFPRVAVRGRDVWVAWQEDASHAPHRPAIMLRHSRDGGVTWDAAATVRALDGRAEHPDIAIAASGRPVLVWQEISSGKAFDIMMQEVGTNAAPRNLSGEGKVISAGQPDDSRSARYPASVWPAVAVSRDGRVAVTWQDNRTDADPLWTGSEAAAGTNPDNWQVQVAVRSASGEWAAPVSIGAAGMADRHPDAEFGAGGELVVAWESKTLNPAGRNLAILSAVSGDGGATFSAPGAVAPDANAMGERPRLGVDLGGSVRAVWQDTRSADWRWRVMTAVRGASGWSAGELQRGRGINTWPATSGGAIVFASTRNAQRLQRDRTQQLFLLPAPR
jgi:hypothetical protein